jgi:hypothetical protein
MAKFVFIIGKKTFGRKERSLDLVLKYLKTNSQLDSNRWLTLDGNSIRIGRTSLDYIVIPLLRDLNNAVDKFIPGFTAFEIKRTEWRTGKYHKAILKNQSLHIDEDDKHYFVEVETNGTSPK